MGDKGDTYYCSWSREADGTCVGWEIRRPTLRATASTPIHLMRMLGKVVGEYYDDHEAALHFDPPLSEAGDPAWFMDDLVQVAWNAGFKFRPSALSAYAKGRCSRCGGGIGERTAIPLEVDEITDSTDGASSPASNEPPPSYGMPGSLKIISEAFMGSLTENERKTFEGRPVKGATPRRQFFELVPYAFVPRGAIRGLEVVGWRCEQCGRRIYGHGGVLGYGVEVVCRQNLPSNSREFFFAGDGTDVHLFCTRRRWREMAGKKWARKLTGDRLAIVDQSQYDADPLLGTLDEIADFRKRHGFKVPFRPSR